MPDHLKDAGQDDHYLKQEFYNLLQQDPAILEFLEAGGLDGLWYWDLEHPAHEWMSRKFWETLGYDPAEKRHLAAEWQHLIFPEDLATAGKNLQKHCADPQHPYDQLVRYRHKNGSTVWVRCHGLAIRDARGKAIRMLGVHNDVTALMRETEERFRATFENAAVGIAHVALDGTWLRLNDCLCEIVGYPREELLTKTFGDITHPDDLEADWVQARRLVAGELANYSMDKRYIRKDGSTIWVTLTGSLVRKPSGEPEYFIVIIRDITALKEAETALRASETRYRATFDNAAVGIAHVGFDGRWIRFNDAMCRITGYSREELSALTFGDITHPDDVESDRGQARRLRGGEIGTYTMEKRYYRKDRALIWVNQTISLLRDREERPTHFVSLIEDISERKRAQSVLVQQQRLYQSVTDNASVALFIMDERQQCVFMNPAAEHLTGYTLAETLGRPLHNLVHHTRPDGRPYPLSECPIDQAFPEQNQMQGEEDFVHKNGHFYSVAFTASPIRNEHGRPVGTILEVQDITERKRAEVALRASEQRFRAAVGAVSSLIWTNNAAGMMEGEQPGWAKFTGQTYDEYQGHGWSKAVHPDDAQPTMDAWNEAVARKSTFVFEHRVRRHDGQWRLCSVRAVPVLTDKGTLREWVGVHTDITEQRQAEAALQESEQRLRFSLEACHIGAWDIDLLDHTAFRSVEHDRIFGYSEPLPEWTLEDFLRHALPEYRESVVKIVRDATAARTGWTYECRIRRADGEIRWIWFSGRFYTDTHGHDRVAGVVQDITERKRAQEALVDSEAKLRQLAADLEQRVQERTAELSESQRRLRALASQLNRAEQRERQRLATELHDHLQQLLALCKIKAGQGRRHAEGALSGLLKDIEDLLAETLTYTRGLVADLSPPVLRDHGLGAALQWLGEAMRKYDLEVSVAVQESSHRRLSPDQAALLFQSVRELLINCAKHAGTGQAWVTLERDRDGLRIQVRDEGRGMDLAPLSGSPGGSQGGMTLKFGLFSIQERMQALGGTFAITSAPETGTAVALTLPLVEAAGVGQVAVAGEPTITRSQLVARDASPQKKTVVQVVLVDDHAMMRQGLRAVLEGYDDIEIVGEASNGEEALTAVGRLRPRVVVMDINMPKMNGIEATGAIKRRHPEIVVVGLSVNADGSNRAAMLAAGASSLLTKEAAVDRLYGAIQDALKVSFS